MLDYLLPTVNVGIFPDGEETTVGLFPREGVIDVNMYSIGEMNPADFFPNPHLKKK